MLDYYFCEECQTYHQPNRYINGQILSACECEISTEPSVDLTQSNIQYSSKKFKHSEIRNPVVINPEQHLHIRYESPRVIRPGPQIVQIQSKAKRVENMPFISIMDQENRNKMKRIITSPNRIQKTSPVFISPRSVKQQIPIRKSISPMNSTHLTTTNRLQAIPKPQFIEPQFLVRKQEIPIQAKMMGTPIHTISKLAFPVVREQQYESVPKMQPQYQAALTASYQPIREDLIAKNLFQNINSLGKTKKVELQRVSGNFRSQYDKDLNALSRNKIQLERATTEYGVVLEKQQKGNCCTNICYN